MIPASPLSSSWNPMPGAASGNAHGEGVALGRRAAARARAVQEDGERGVKYDLPAC